MASIKKNFIYSGILTSANYIFPLIVYPYVSRVLGVTRIGACNFVDSIVQYFILLSMFGITSIGVREIAKAKNDKDRLNQVYNSIFWTNALFTIISVVLLIVVIFSVQDLYEYRKLLYVGVLKVVSNFFLIDWLFRGLEEFKYITIRTLLVKCLYVIAVFLFIKEETDYTTYYLLTVMMITVNSILNHRYSRNFVKVSFRNIKCGTFIYPIIIMGVYSVMTSMYTTFNTAYLGFVAGDKEVGYYTTAHTLYGALLALFGAFTNVMLPRMSSLVSEGNIERFKYLLSKSSNILFSYSIPFVLLFIVYAPEIINLYAGKGFEGAILPMQISMPLMIVIGYEQIIITQGLLPLDKNKAVLVNAIIGAFVGVVLSLIIVGKLKSVGSTLVWTVSELCVLISASVFIKKYLNYRFPLVLLLKELMSYFPLLIVLIYTHNIFNSHIMDVLSGGIITVTYTFVIQRFILKQKELVDITDSIVKLLKRS